jgi:hypothetical protein
MSIMCVKDCPITPIVSSLGMWCSISDPRRIFLLC